MNIHEEQEKRYSLKFRKAVCEVIGHDDPDTVVEQLKKEWHDYSMVVDHCSRVMMHATGGQVSKPLTLPDTVNAIIDDHVSETVDFHFKDRIEPVVDKLKEIEAHHVRLNQRAGREPEKSNTLRMLREALKGLTGE